jgi:hypothetical protein
MIGPLKKSFTRLAGNIDTTRRALDEQIKTGQVLDSQRPVLAKIDAELLDLHDSIISILTIWNIAAAKQQEGNDVLSTAIDDLADTATLIGGTDAFLFEPAGIRYLLAGASERNAIIAISLLDDNTRNNWLEWLNDGR